MEPKGLYEANGLYETHLRRWYEYVKQVRIVAIFLYPGTKGHYVIAGEPNGTDVWRCWDYDWDYDAKTSVISDERIGTPEEIMKEFMRRKNIAKGARTNMERAKGLSVIHLKLGQEDNPNCKAVFWEEDGQWGLCGYYFSDEDIEKLREEYPTHRIRVYSWTELPPKNTDPNLIAEAQDIGGVTSTEGSGDLEKAVDILKALKESLAEAQKSWRKGD